LSEQELFVVSAPSGTGKTTLIRELLVRIPGLKFSVSFTTRPIRQGERDGIDYHFVDEAQFDAMVASNELLEWARVHGQRYGTGVRQVEETLAEGSDLLLDVDTQGARSVRSLRPESVFIFIMPPDFRTLEERLLGRGGASPEEVRRRIGNAREEMERYVEYDYVVINDSLPEALGSLEAIVLSRRRRRPRMEAHCRKVMETFRSH